MSDNRHVVWSLESSNQIESIKNYLLEEWSESEAINFLLKLWTFEKIVVRFPKLYPSSLRYPEIRKAVITKHQSVIYEIDGNIIRVLTILDHRQMN